MKKFMQLLLASFGILALAFVGCNTAEEDAVVEEDAEVLEVEVVEDESSMDDESAEEEASEEEVMEEESAE